MNKFRLMQKIQNSLWKSEIRKKSIINKRALFSRKYPFKIRKLTSKETNIRLKSNWFNRIKILKRINDYFTKNKESIIIVNKLMKWSI